MPSILILKIFSKIFSTKKSTPKRSAFNSLDLTTYAIKSFTSAAKFLGSNLIPGPIVVDR